LFARREIRAALGNAALLGLSLGIRAGLDLGLTGSESGNLGIYGGNFICRRLANALDALAGLFDLAQHHLIQALVLFLVVFAELQDVAFPLDCGCQALINRVHVVLLFAPSDACATPPSSDGWP